MQEVLIGLVALLFGSTLGCATLAFISRRRARQYKLRAEQYERMAFAYQETANANAQIATRCCNESIQLRKELAKLRAAGAGMWQGKQS